MLKRIHSKSMRAEVPTRGVGRLLHSPMLAYLALALACAGEGVKDSAEPQALGTATQALHTDQWNVWSSTTASTAILGDPTICSNQVGYVIAVRNSDNRYYVRRTTSSTNPTWKQFGTRQFAGSPSCTMQYPAPGTDPKFLMAGRADDNRLYVVEGRLPTPTGSVPPNPVLTGPWEQVSSTEYRSAAPLAIGSSGELAVLTFSQRGRFVFAHTRALPYAGSTWSSRIDAPRLPNDVFAGGAPAIAFMSGSRDRFVVMVTGEELEGTSPGLYWIEFDGKAFLGDWVKALVPHPIDSAPAMEWDEPNGALTVYFRSGNEVLQTSVPGPGDLGMYPFRPIPNRDDTVVLGAPRVVYSGGIAGVRAAVVLGYDDRIPADRRDRGLLITEGSGEPSP